MNFCVQLMRLVKINGQRHDGRNDNDPHIVVILSDEPDDNAEDDEKEHGA